MLIRSSELREILYTLFSIYVSSLVLLVYNLFQLNKKKSLLSDVSLMIFTRHQVKGRYPESRLILFLTIAEIVLISLFQHGLVAVFNKVLGKILNTGTNYFGMIYVMPLLLPLYCWMLGLDPRKQIDLITPAYPLALFCLKIGCFFGGCCKGIVCEFGFYHYSRQRTEFPIQLLEAAIALAIFFYLHVHRNHAKEGTLLPKYIILYSTTRFFSEFLRGSPSFLGPLKFYQILCLIGILTGVAQYMCLFRFSNQIDRIFLHNYPWHLKNRTHSVRDDKSNAPFI